MARIANPHDRLWIQQPEPDDPNQGDQAVDEMKGRHHGRHAQGDGQPLRPVHIQCHAEHGCRIDRDSNAERPQEPEIDKGQRGEPDQPAHPRGRRKVAKPERRRIGRQRREVPEPIVIRLAEERAERGAADIRDGAPWRLENAAPGSQDTAVELVVFAPLEQLVEVADAFEERPFPGAVDGRVSELFGMQAGPIFRSAHGNGVPTDFGDRPRDGRVRAGHRHAGAADVRGGTGHQKVHAVLHVVRRHAALAIGAEHEAAGRRANPGVEGGGDDLARIVHEPHARVTPADLGHEVARTIIAHPVHDQNLDPLGRVVLCQQAVEALPDVRTLVAYGDDHRDRREALDDRSR